MRATNAKFYAFSNKKLSSLTIDDENSRHNASTYEYSTISAHPHKPTQKEIQQKSFLRTLSNPRNQWQMNERAHNNNRSRSAARKNNRFVSIYAQPFKQRIKVNNDYINVQQNPSFKNTTDYLKALGHLKRNGNMYSRNESPSYPNIKVEPRTISTNENRQFICPTETECKPNFRSNLYVKKRERSITPIIQNAPLQMNKTCEDVYQIELNTTKRNNHSNKFASVFKREMLIKQININANKICEAPALCSEDGANTEEKGMCTKINQIRAKNKYKSRPSNSRYDSLPLQEDSMDISYKHKVNESEKCNQYSDISGFKNDKAKLQSNQAKKLGLSSVETQETEKKDKSIMDNKYYEDINPLSQDYSMNDMRKISEIISSGLGKKAE